MGGTGVVGRRDELARLDALAARVRDGAASVVLLDGAPGVGKTEVVDRLAARLADFTLVRTRAPAGGAPPPGAVLERCLAAAGGSGAADVPLLLGTALLAALEDLDRRGPVLFVVDDLDRADPESLGVLRLLLRRLTPLRVLAVLTGRDRPDGWLDLAGAAGGWGDDAVRLHLDGLTVADVDDLTRAAGRRGTAWTVRRLHEETAGNPLHVRAVLAESDLPDRYRLGRARPPGTLTAALRARLDALPAAPRRVLEAMAVLGEPASLPDLTALAGPDAPACTAALVDGGLAVRQADETGEHLAFPSPVLRDAVYTGTPAARRRALHRAAADRTGGTARWRHLVGATDGPDRALADGLDAAAAEAIERGDLVPAAEYLRWACECSDDDRLAGRRLIDAVRLLVYAAREGEALQHADAIECLPDSAARSEIRGLLAFARDEVASARDLLLLARDEASAEGDTELGARIDVELAYVHTQLGAGEAATAAARRALRDRPDLPRLCAVARAFLAAGAALTDGAPAGLEQLAFLPARPVDAAPPQLPALIQRGVLSGLLGRLDPAVADLTVAARRRTPFTRFLGMAADLHLVWCHYLLGEWDAARRALEVAVAGADQYARSFDHAALRSLSAILHAGRGEEAAARADLEAAVEHAEAADFLGPRVHLALARGAIAQAAGRPGEVVAALSPLTPGAIEADRVRLLSGWWLPAIADSQIDLGWWDEAQRTIDDLARVPVRGSCLPVARAWVGGRLAAARGDIPLACRLFEDGLAIPAEGGEPGWYRARLRHAYGCLMLRVGEPAVGRAALAQACRTFARLGARPFLDRARLDGELASSDPGGDPADDPGRWTDALSDREREVAGLVGRGWTNPEIAAELFVSAKTVEYHLRNVYGKLGIRGRRALRDRVQQVG
ncbi:LuxR C-terminal-related transcriptional regulator [Actinomycetospora lutea]|uniref:helix-turn-helix transcriptional regulator n=1 Tax=Actinomycetospora lutea TaxID=663604 RepID=UPI00236714B4|nr:LuxR family transcriptional regulator [Actinomycetospora lutea]MDD7942799.1 LuxR C-terminal-related transcriptional regulator [Actinomycetospora lutea]